MTCGTLTSPIFRFWRIFFQFLLGTISVCFCGTLVPKWEKKSFRSTISLLQFYLLQCTWNSLVNLHNPLIQQLTIPRLWLKKSTAGSEQGGFTARKGCRHEWRPRESQKLLPKGMKFPEIPTPGHPVPDPKHNVEQLHCCPHSTQKTKDSFACFWPHVLLNLHPQTKAFLRYFLHSPLFRFHFHPFSILVT